VVGPGDVVLGVGLEDLAVAVAVFAHRRTNLDDGRPLVAMSNAMLNAAGHHALRVHSDGPGPRAPLSGSRASRQSSEPNESEQPALSFLLTSTGFLCQPRADLGSSLRPTAKGRQLVVAEARDAAR
jgi:hypothetical protein